MLFAAVLFRFYYTPHGKRGMPFWTCIKIKIKVTAWGLGRRRVAGGGAVGMCWMLGLF